MNILARAPPLSCRTPWPAVCPASPWRVKKRLPNKPFIFHKHNKAAAAYSPQRESLPRYFPSGSKGRKGEMSQRGCRPPGEAAAGRTRQQIRMEIRSHRAGAGPAPPGAPFTPGLPAGNKVRFSWPGRTRRGNYLTEGTLELSIFKIAIRHPTEANQTNRSISEERPINQKMVLRCWQFVIIPRVILSV